MTQTFLTAVVCLTASLSCAPHFEEIADASGLELLNPDLKSREIAKIRLANGLEAYLVSDPEASQSAAALTVQAGSWDDPESYPGMAHFCEHMLFMGSKAYPDEREFSALVANHAGQTNAYTAADRTVYMVSAAHDGFPPLLTRFSRFFIDPLFHPSGISRELYAVDQEFAKNVEHDGWREFMIFKETGNPAHPNAKFSIGNSATLGNIPQEALIDWHATHYSAERMRLVLYSSLPLSALKDLAASLFSAVPQAPASERNDLLPLTSDRQRGSLLYIKPIKERKSISLSWELPRELSLDPAKSAHLVAYALTRGQPNSLRELLKREDLIETLSASVGSLGGGKAHQFLEISFDLTDKGLNDPDNVVLHFFEAIALLKAESIPPYLFDEMQQSVKTAYQYQSRTDPFQYASSIAPQLLDEDLATYPKQTLLASAYDSQTIQSALDYLTPERALIVILADPAKTGVPTDSKERWMGGEYTFRSLPNSVCSLWRNAAPHPDLRIAPPNPFIPSSFALSEMNDPNPARLLASHKGGIAYYAPRGSYQTPEAVLTVRILSPLLELTLDSQCLAELYLDHLADSLYPTLAAASQAGLKANLSFDKNRLAVRVTGFSDKAPLLLQEVLAAMHEIPPPSSERFELYRQRHIEDCMNGDKDLAAKQAMEFAVSLLNPSQYPKKEKLPRFKEVSYAQFLAFYRDLFAKTYLEGMLSGNLSSKEAAKCWSGVRRLFGKKYFPKDEHPQAKVLALPQNGPFAIERTTEALGNAALLTIDLGEFTFERRAAQDVLQTALRESFFDTLRTKQKTGYIAHSTGFELELRLFQQFLVQSNSHQPDDLLHRFELFLETTLQEFPAFVSEERFATLKTSLKEALRTRFRNLIDQASLWEELAFERNARFTWLEERLQGYDQLNYETFRALSQEFLSRENRRRLAVLFTGKLNAPFAYEPTTPAEFLGQGEYLTRSEQFLRLRP